MKESEFSSRREYEEAYRYKKLYDKALFEAERTYAEFWLFCKAYGYDMKNDCKNAWSAFVSHSGNISAYRAADLYGGNGECVEINRHALVDYMRTKQ